MASTISGVTSHFILLKTLENLWLPGVFRGYKMETLTRNGLKILKLILKAVADTQKLTIKTLQRRLMTSFWCFYC